MKILRISFLSFIIVFVSIGISQAQLSSYDTSYVYTALDEDFEDSSLDNDLWKRINFKRGVGLLLDSSATIDVEGGKLRLTMISCPNCNTIGSYDGKTYFADYAGGEIETKKYYQYGIFECRARFAELSGAWPAFWMIGGDTVPCPPGGYDDEIDMAEYFCRGSYNQMEHNIHHYYPNTSCEKLSEKVDHEGYEYYLNNSYHIFKCIWTPTKIEYFIDGQLKYSVTNNNQVFSGSGKEWFPTFPKRIKLSQQIITPSSYPDVVTPQTSYFDWVRVREFFEPPTITLSSDLICTSGTASMNVDQAATNISWSLSPTSLFTGATSGTGNNASFNVSSSASGEGTITYSFEMPGGETFTAEESFWAGRPGTPLTIPSGYPTLEMALGAYQPISIFKSPGAYGGNINWWCTGSIEIDGASNANTCTFEATDLGIGNFYVTTQNTCGTSPTGGGAVNVVSGGGGQMMLVISPNPACNEVSITIESELEEEITLMSNETILDTNIEWNLEIYDNLQSLKLKKKKLKGKSTVIETHGWKEGIYLVRAKYKEEILQGKLMVKK